MIAQCVKDVYEYNTVGVATWGHMDRKVYRLEYMKNSPKIHKNHVSRIQFVYDVCQDINNNPGPFGPDEVPFNKAIVLIAFNFVENSTD